MRRLMNDRQWRRAGAVSLDVYGKMLSPAMRAANLRIHTFRLVVKRRLPNYLSRLAFG